MGLELGAGAADGELAGLAALLGELALVARSAGGSGWALELADYEAMAPGAQLRLLLQGSEPETVRVSPPLPPPKKPPLGPAAGHNKQPRARVSQDVLLR